MRTKSDPFLLKVTMLIAIAGTLSSQSAPAMYVRPDLVNVPIERLIKNLEALAKEKPQVAEFRLNLARAHAMAYALKTDTAEVWKGRESNGVWFGYEPAHVPFEVKPSSDPTRVKAAREHLAKSIEWYGEVLKLQPANLTAALGHAWCVDQSGAKQKAITEYRKVIADAWEKEKDMRTAGLGWHSVTAEAAGYLIPLLDTQKDKGEINTLKARAQRMGSLPRPITPLVIPLRDGLMPAQLEDRSASVGFDADGTGLKKRWTWITKDAGWLIYDPHGTGKVTSALQMFGSVTFWMFWENGYHALGAMDDNRDGKLSGDELRGLAIWRDANRNGVSDRGEIRPLADWGIIALSCRFVLDEAHADQMAYSPEGVLFRDGSKRPTYDLILRPAVASVD